ncbi:DUF2846 domain-containing protein [Vibrio parahaemolyticus]|uniref:DUF2846 domain-containing protein n=1 Tax=Vibrio parahaemolyticus TaxID=670 RepID=UPI00111F364D|nr:DUF2846 domain-containing protein [Vibrio parahaemolyticus]TOJ94156.1 hypothetical protein CGI27_24810 [Vibrio parahaemolyticus]
MLKRISVSILVLSLISGCSATGLNFTELETVQENQAKVYFYRPWAMLDGAASPTVQINGIDSFNISNGGYEIINIEPGYATFTVSKGGFMSNWRAPELNIATNLEAKTVYFVRLTAEITNASFISGISSISGGYSLGIIERSTALNELRDTKRN